MATIPTLILKFLNFAIKKYLSLLLTIPFIACNSTTRCEILWSTQNSLEKSCGCKYTRGNIGKCVNKFNFAAVFHEAFDQAVKVTTILNSFHDSGIYPVNFSAIHLSKMSPSSVIQRVCIRLVRMKCAYNYWKK